MSPRKNLSTIFGCLIISIILMAIPTGFEGALQFRDAEKCRVLVEEVDNSKLIDTGLIRTGQQVCSVKILSGKFKGQLTEGWNMLGGSLSQDKLFRPGDIVQAIVHYETSVLFSQPDRLLQAKSRTHTSSCLCSFFDFICRDDWHTICIFICNYNSCLRSNHLSQIIDKAILPEAFAASGFCFKKIAFCYSAKQKAIFYIIQTVFRTFLQSFQAAFLRYFPSFSRAALKLLLRKRCEAP